MADAEYYKDKQHSDWRLKFTADDYFEHPEYWSYEVQLPMWADFLYQKGYKGVCALDFYEDLFDDDDIAPKVVGKKFEKGAYSPKILKISPKPTERLTPKELAKVSAWEQQHGDVLSQEMELEKEIANLEKEIHRLERKGPNLMDDGLAMVQNAAVLKKQLRSLKGARLLAKQDLQELRDSRTKRPNFVMSKVDYIFQGKDNLWNTISYSSKTDFLVVRPVSYAGRSMQIENARYLHAMVIEIDGLKVRPGEPSEGLDELIYCWERTSYRLPKPTYIVCSGSGVHLYFIFERPIPLFANVMNELNEMRLWLVDKFWNSYVSDEAVQAETLTQGFRVVGSYAKNHRAIVCAFQVGDKVDLEYMNSFVPESKRVTVIYKRQGLSLEDAEKAYPDWYERRIVKKDPKGIWPPEKFGRNMYDWWLRKTLAEAKDGCRGYMVENLCSLALKCGIPEHELDRDLEILRIELDKRTEKLHNDFDEADIERCKSTYLVGGYRAYARKTEFLRNKFKKYGIEIPVTKRNGRKQADHLVRARFSRDLEYPNGEWREGNGRPDKKDIVKVWRLEHPNGTKAECIRETGLAKHTVYKWWDAE